LFYLIDNVDSKYIISVQDQLCIKSVGVKQLGVGQWNKSLSERWKFISAKGNGYHIKNCNSGKVIDIPSSHTQSGTIVN
jgi:hypothetical protein